MSDGQIGARMSEGAWLRESLALIASSTLLACGGAPPPESTTASEPAPQARAQPAPEACDEQWIHMPIVIYFGHGSAEVDVEQRAILEEVVSSAHEREDIRRIRVEGHISWCAQDRDANELGSRRAEAVRQVLVELGIDPEVLEVVSYGGSQPRAGKQACSEERSFNSRVEFSLLVCRDSATAHTP